MMEINIAHFYPELLNLYGDAGNIAALKKRLEWRGIKVNILNIGISDEPDFSHIDIALLGGGSDKEQCVCLEEMRKYRDGLAKYIEDDGIFLALCGGYPVLGNYYETENKRVDGLGILDIYTDKSPKRYISNIIIENNLGKIAGFENHYGKTYTGSYNSFGVVLYGNGNNGEDKKEGVRYRNLYATYLHGPLLPKNPTLTDEILNKAIKKKYPDAEPLISLDDSLENEALKAITSRFIKE